MISINWKDKRWLGKKGSQLFEELCYELLDHEGFKNLQWRKGSYDEGRDIQGEKDEQQFDGSIITKKYWFQCKRFASGISLKHITVSLSQAEVNNVNYFVIMTNSHLTPALQDHIEKYNSNNNLKIQKIDGKGLEKRIFKHERKFKNIEFYFEENTKYEVLLKNIRKKEEKQFEDLNQNKNELIKKLSENKYKDNEAFKAIILLSNKYLKFRFNKDALDVLKESEKYFIDKKNKIQLQIEIGKIYLQLERGESARTVFGELIRQNKDIRDVRTINYLELYYARALFLCFNYKDSLKYYKKLKNYFTKQRGKIKEDFLLAYVDLLVEITGYPEAKNYLKLLKKDRRNLYEQILQRELKIFNKERKWDNVENIYKSIKSNDKKKSNLWINIYYEFAYAFWKTDKISLSIKILEEDCFNLIRKSGTEEDLMILFQNLSNLKMKEEPFSRTSWDYYEKWLDISEKMRNKYHYGIMKGLYSSEYLVENKFPDSLESLFKSQRIFESINSWSNVEQNYNRFGLLFQHSGNYLEALKNYIMVSNEKAIKNVSKIIMEYYDKDSINNFFEHYLETRKYFTSEKIGLCHSISSIAEVLSEENLREAFRILLKFAKDKYSSNKEFNIQRPALKALLNIIYLLTKAEKKEVYLLIKSLYTVNTFWDIKEILSSILVELDEYDFITSIPKEISYWGNIYLAEKNTPDKLFNQLENFLFQLAGTDLDKFSKDVRKVFSKSKRFGNIEVAHKLKVLNSNQVEKLINDIENYLNNSIKIEDNLQLDSPVQLKGYLMQRSYVEDNKRITVGLISGLFPPELIKDYKINSSTIENYILTIISLIENKYNLLINRELLIGLLVYIIVPNHLLDRVYNIIEIVFENKLEFTKADLKDFQDNINPFSRDRIEIGSFEKIIANAIYLCCENFDLFKPHQKEYIKSKIMDYSANKSEEVRIACLYFFKFIEVNELQFFLGYYRLMIDQSENVVGNAIYGLSEIDPAKWEMKFYIQIIGYIFVNIPQYRSIITRRASAKLLSKLYKQNTLKGNTEMSTRLKELIYSLKNDKYYSVRKELETIDC